MRYHYSCTTVGEISGKILLRLGKCHLLDPSVYFLEIVASLRYHVHVSISFTTETENNLFIRENLRMSSSYRCHILTACKLPLDFSGTDNLQRAFRTNATSSWWNDFRMLVLQVFHASCISRGNGKRDDSESCVYYIFFRVELNGIYI